MDNVGFTVGGPPRLLVKPQNPINPINPINPKPLKTQKGTLPLPLLKALPSRLSFEELLKSLVVRGARSADSLEMKAPAASEGFWVCLVVFWGLGFLGFRVWVFWGV